MRGHAVRGAVGASGGDRGELVAPTVHVPSDRAVERVPRLGDVGPCRERRRVVRQVAPRVSLPLVPVSDVVVDGGLVGCFDEHASAPRGGCSTSAVVASPSRGGRPVTTTEALGAWGAYDRDDPFPLFAAVRELGPVHAVTLADGHDAWLVVGYEEARVALNDPRLSKDMHAALATGDGVVAEGLPGPSFARHMLSVDPPDHSRLRRLVSAAFTPRRVEALRPRVQAIVDDLLDAIAAAGPDARIDLVGAFAFPLPFTVICELLGVPEPDRGRPGTGTHRAARPHLDPGRVRTGEGGVRRGRRDARSTRRRQAGQPRRRPRERAHQRPRRRRAAQHPRAAVDDLPAHRRRPRHDREPHRQRRRRPAPASRAARAICGPIPPSSPSPSRSSSATTRRCPTRRSATRSHRWTSVA